MGFKLKKAATSKPKVSAFAAGDDSSEESDNETKLMKNVAKKRRKIEKETIAAHEATVLGAEIDQLDAEKPVLEPSTKSKYIGKILEAKKKREQDQLEALIRNLEKKMEGEVFESAEYKLQKQQVLLRTEEKDDGNFYKTLLGRRTGEESEREAEQEVKAGLQQNSDTGEQNTPRNSENTVRNSQKTRLDPDLGPEPSRQLIEKLKEYCRSKISEQQLQAYKDRYRQRHKNYHDYN